METRIEPKLITVLREDYTRSLFARDLGAGFIVGERAHLIMAQTEAKKHA